VTTTNKVLTAVSCRVSTPLGAGDTDIGTEQDVSDLMGVTVVGTIINGGSGPTSNPTFSLVWRSGDGTRDFVIGPFEGDQVSASTTQFTVSVPDAAFEILSVFVGGTLNAQTAECIGAGIKLNTA